MSQVTSFIKDKVVCILESHKFHTHPHHTHTSLELHNTFILSFELKWNINVCSHAIQNSTVYTCRTWSSVDMCFWTPGPKHGSIDFSDGQVIQNRHTGLGWFSGWRDGVGIWGEGQYMWYMRCFNLSNECAQVTWNNALELSLQSPGMIADLKVPWPANNCTLPFTRSPEANCHFQCEILSSPMDPTHSLYWPHP